MHDWSSVNIEPFMCAQACIFSGLLLEKILCKTFHNECLHFSDVFPSNQIYRRRLSPQLSDLLDLKSFVKCILHLSMLICSSSYSLALESAVMSTDDYHWTIANGRLATLRACARIDERTPTNALLTSMNCPAACHETGAGWSHRCRPINRHPTMPVSAYLFIR